MSLRVLSTVIAAAAVLATAPATAATYDQVVVFGDSLVDAGNVFLATGGFAATNTFNNPSRGYFPGRFTNGPDYTDLLNAKLFGTYSTAALAGGSNYAFGGATYVANNDPVPDLAAQVGLYATGSVAFGLSAHAVDPNALYIINFGGNDVFAIDSGAVPAAFVPDSTTSGCRATAERARHRVDPRRGSGIGVPRRREPGPPGSAGRRRSRTARRSVR